MRFSRRPDQPDHTIFTEPAANRQELGEPNVADNPIGAADAWKGHLVLSDNTPWRGASQRRMLRSLLIMSPLCHTWRSFQTLAANSEAATASACCHFSLGTLEITSPDPGLARFALTEQKRPDMWRWAIVDTQGYIIGTGCEPTREKARLVAELELGRCPA